MEPTSESIQSLSDWVLSRSDHSAQDPNIGFVETLYHTCSSALVYLWRYRFRFAPQGPRKNTLKKDVADIRLWEENFPPGRLDAILGQSHHLKLNVVENLKGIGTILRLYLTGCDDSTTKEQHQTDSGSGPGLAQELDTQLEKAAIMLSSEDCDLSSDDELSDDSSSTSEREQNRFGRIHCYVSCLIDMAPSIEKRITLAPRRVEPQQIHAENTMTLSPNAQPFVMRIQDRLVVVPGLALLELMINNRFSIGLTPLVERLAQANWERSIRIRAQYREQLYTVDHDDVTLFKPYSTFNDSGLGTSVPTRSQYAASATSHTSFLSMPGTEAHGHPRVPSLPRGDGRPFQCDYCQKKISLQGRIEWKMHVFADLQSYLCTHAECEDALKTFPSRKMWADHEFNNHFTQQQWRCFICNTTITNESSFVEHLSLSHNIKLSGSRLAAAISEAQEAACNQQFKDNKCALCSKHGWPTRKAYVTHVGQHLEEISLASLPRDENDKSDSDSGHDTPSNRSTRSLQPQTITPSSAFPRGPMTPPTSRPYKLPSEDGDVSDTGDGDTGDGVTGDGVASDTEPPHATSTLVNTAVDHHMKWEDAEPNWSTSRGMMGIEVKPERNKPMITHNREPFPNLPRLNPEYLLPEYLHSIPPEDRHSMYARPSFQDTDHRPHALGGHNLAQAGPSPSSVPLDSSGLYQYHELGNSAHGLVQRNAEQVPALTQATTFRNPGSLVEERHSPLLPQVGQNDMYNYLMTPSNSMPHIDNRQITTAPKLNSERIEGPVNQDMEETQNLSTQDHEKDGASVLAGFLTPISFAPAIEEIRRHLGLGPGSSRFTDHEVHEEIRRDFDENSQCRSNSMRWTTQPTENSDEGWENLMQWDADDNTIDN